MALLTRVEGMRDQIIRSTQELVRIKSVKADELPGKPYGEGINDCLEYVLKLGQELGFETLNTDGWAGHIEMGQGDEIVGVLVHLDVVPEGSNWTYPPYGAEIHDNKIFGRGTIDDKGPAIAALYALKAIKDVGIQLGKRVRLIFGTDEEIGGPGLDYYLERAGLPDIGFSPDASFPAIHGEKGIMVFTLEQDFSRKSGCTGSGLQLKSIKGGNAPNMVPDYCEAILVGDDYSKVQDTIKQFAAKHHTKLEWEEAGNQLLIRSYGISAHGSMPETGVNAISQLMTFLAELNLDSSDSSDFVRFYAEKIGMEYYGESIGCGLEDKVSGKLIFNVGLVDLNSDSGKVIVNVRYPVTSSQEEVYQEMAEKLKESEVRVVPGNHLAPLFIPADDELIVKLMTVYRELTGDDSEPITIGGGTYARSIKKAVAFGPLFPGQPELAHQKDEYIAIDDLILNAKIYAKAIVALAK